jgi:Na+/melibiose symporter-like transporter
MRRERQRFSRDVRLWMTGTSVSLLGDAALWIALGVWVKDITHSNSRAGLAFLAYLSPRLLAPFTGLLADRFRRRPLITVLNLVLAGWVSLAFLVHGTGTVWLLYVVLFGVGLGSGIHSAAGSALLTQLVDRERLGPANATLRTVQEVGLLVAPAIGTLLYVQLGARAVAGLDAATFVACALCVAAVRTREPRPEPHADRLVRELMAGAHHLWRTPALREVVVGMGGALLAFGFIETVIFAVVDQGLHREAAFVGVLTVIKGGGSVTGGFAAMRIVRRLPPGGESWLTVLGLGLLAGGAGILILPGTVAAVAGVVVIGLGIPMAIVGLYTVVQRNSPAQLQGRVAAAASALVTGPQVLSVATGAGLIVVVDYHVLLAVIVAVIGLSAGYLATRNVAAGRAVLPPAVADVGGSPAADRA